MFYLSAIADRLKEPGVNIIQVAAKTGLHYQTLYKIMRGQKDVSYTTYIKLVEYFQAVDKENGKK